MYVKSVKFRKQIIVIGNIFSYFLVSFEYHLLINDMKISNIIHIIKFLMTLQGIQSIPCRSFNCNSL